MANNYQKGVRNRKKCIDYFELRGWKVAKVETHNKYSKETDLFGLFDLIAIKGDNIRFIQVTSNTPHTHKNYKKFKQQHNIGGIYQFVWIDYKGFKIYKYEKDKHILLKENEKV